MYFCLLAKSPHMNGRIGPKDMQDWRRILERAVALAREVPDAKFLVVTAFQATGEESEACTYIRELAELAPDVPVVWIDKGYETVEQIEAIRRHALDRPNEAFVIISTFLQYPRVRWLAWGMRVRHSWTLGIPRLSEVPRDVLLIFAMPIIDLCGQRARYLRWLKARRRQGIL